MAHVLGPQERTLAEAGTVGQRGLITALDPRVRIVMSVVFAVVVVSLLFWRSV